MVAAKQLWNVLTTYPKTEDFQASLHDLEIAEILNIIYVFVYELVLIQYRWPLLKILYILA